MNKYPLIGGSILAVVLFVMATLTNVVGYQSVKSSTMSKSPLFSVRTQKATNHQQNKITSHYLGMGNRTFLVFKPRDNRIESLKKALEIISKTDNKTYAQFEKLFINSIRQEPVFHDADIKVIKQMLQLIRDEPLLILYAKNNTLNSDITDDMSPTLCIWFHGCFLKMIAGWTLEIVLMILAIPLVIAMLIKAFIQSFIDNYLFTIYPPCDTVKQCVTIWPRPCPNNL